MESTPAALLDKARRFRTPRAPKSSTVAGLPCLVLLGRAGDIIDSLPIALHFFRQFKVPIPFVVQKQFMDILKCASYVDPISWDGELFMTVNEAVKWAQSKYQTVYCLQTWGHQYNPGMHTKSFCDEHFRLANLTGRRGELPIVFDRRDGEREEKLLNRFNSKLPIILYNLSGYSSPFQHKDLIKQELSRYSGVATLIDTNKLAECFVDLLALYSVAAALITIDTGTLHLAGACRVPYIALTVDSKQPWHTSPPLGNCRLNIPYSKVPAMLPEIRKVLDALVSIPEVQPVVKKFTGKIIHVTDSYWLMDPRCSAAVNSWIPLYRQGLLHAAHTPTLGLYKRDSRDIGSKRKLPFLKDILEMGMKHAKDEDVLLWTNSDILLTGPYIGSIMERAPRAPILCGRRVDFATGKPHPGRDVAVFSVRWLRENWQRIPDLLCGCAEIDVWISLCAREQVGLTAETPARMFIDIEPVDIPPGGAKHMDHGVSEWDNPATRFQEPGNVYNVTLLRRWCRDHQPKIKFTRDGFVDWHAL